MALDAVYFSESFGCYCSCAKYHREENEFETYGQTTCIYIYYHSDYCIIMSYINTLIVFDKKYNLF